MKKKLTDKQEMFCLEFMKDFNATRAAKAAGYSEKTARSQGQRLLTNVDIQNYLSELKAKVKEKIEGETDWITEEFEKIAKAEEIEQTKDRLKALTELAKMAGKYDKHNDQKKPEVTVNIPPIDWTKPD